MLCTKINFLGFSHGLYPFCDAQRSRFACKVGEFFRDLQNVLRELWKDLDDYDQGINHRFLLKVVDFDQEIKEANAAMWRVFGAIIQLG